ncbi:hypothetical protein EVAR_44759_1 [Eumeta japonica]|uniref:Uncharacterized protein n=1 Tax=Eumeta variegata TaxID=151549 RepID=A0A4C1XJN1_EUMVA|nr:hypothetical protein EVAR_44759_1 [Eumeta japonica]
MAIRAAAAHSVALAPCASPIFRCVPLKNASEAMRRGRGVGCLFTFEFGRRCSASYSAPAASPHHKMRSFTVNIEEAIITWSGHSRRSSPAFDHAAAPL